jgi:hypothetical protein
VWLANSQGATCSIHCSSVSLFTLGSAESVACHPLPHENPWAHRTAIRHRRSVGECTMVSGLSLATLQIRARCVCVGRRIYPGAGMHHEVSACGSRAASDAAGIGHVLGKGSTWGTRLPLPLVFFTPRQAYLGSHRYVWVSRHKALRRPAPVFVKTAFGMFVPWRAWLSPPAGQDGWRGVCEKCMRLGPTKLSDTNSGTITAEQTFRAFACLSAPLCITLI